MYQNKRSDILSAEKKTHSRVSSVERWNMMEHDGTADQCRHPFWSWILNRHIRQPLASGCQCQRSDQVRVRMERVIPCPNIEGNRLCASYWSKEITCITCNRKVKRDDPGPMVLPSPLSPKLPARTSWWFHWRIQNTEIPTGSLSETQNISEVLAAGNKFNGKDVEAESGRVTSLSSTSWQS